MSQNSLSAAPDRIYSHPVGQRDFKELHRALTESACKNKFLSLDAPQVQDAAVLGGKLLEKLKRLLKESGSDMPLDAMCVTPADFVLHADNLKSLGTLGLRRILP